MEPGAAYDMWRDYLGLAAVLAALPPRRDAEEASVASPAVVPEPAAASPAVVPEPASSSPTAVPEPAASSPAAVPEPVASSPAAVPEPVVSSPAAVPEPVASSPAAVPEPAASPADKTLCVFCKQNGETAQVYGGHRLRDAAGRVLCPVLRSYVCPQCGATQDRAHTKRFCPLTRRGYASVYSRAGGKRHAKK